jgi:hypothetical protein
MIGDCNGAAGGSGVGSGGDSGDCDDRISAAQNSTRNRLALHCGLRVTVGTNRVLRPIV